MTDSDLKLPVPVPRRLSGPADASDHGEIKKMNVTGGVRSFILYGLKNAN